MRGPDSREALTPHPARAPRNPPSPTRGEGIKSVRGPLRALNDPIFKQPSEIARIVGGAGYAVVPAPAPVLALCVFGDMRRAMPGKSAGTMPRTASCASVSCTLRDICWAWCGLSIGLVLVGTLICAADGLLAV